MMILGKIRMNILVVGQFFFKWNNTGGRMEGEF